MYINGRKISLEELQHIADKLVGSLINEMYENILKDGLDICIPGTQYKQRQILKKMERHYIHTEQYEKCAVLRDIIKSNFNLKNKKNGKK